MYTIILRVSFFAITRVVPFSMVDANWHHNSEHGKTKTPLPSLYFPNLLHFITFLVLVDSTCSEFFHHFSRLLLSANLFFIMGKRSRDEQLLHYERNAAKERREVEKLGEQEITLPQSQGGSNPIITITTSFRRRFGQEINPPLPNI